MHVKPLGLAVHPSKIRVTKLAILDSPEISETGSDLKIT